MNAANKMWWLQGFLDEAAAEGLCVARHCPTCGSGAFSERLLRAVRSASGIDRTARGWTSGTLRHLAEALARLPAISRRDEPALRTIIMRLYDFNGDAAFEDDFAPGFHAGPAGEILRSMREHFAARQTAKQDHRERNDPKAVEARRAEKRTVGMLRQTQRRAKYAQDFASARPAANGENTKMTSSEPAKIDQGFRPARYFGPTRLESYLRSTIKGSERRGMVASILRDGDAPLPVGLAEPGLSDDARVSWGAIHPSMMGGEYLPDRRGRELEIARITIQSTTQDVTCVYAFQGRGRLRYRVVDEYDGDCLQGSVRRTSSLPLRLGELTDFLLGAWDLFQVLEMNFSGGVSSLEDALAFFRGESAFYPDFDALLRSRVKAWWTETRDEQSKADDRHAQWMEVTIPVDLIRAYEATDYWVEAPAGKMVLKIGQPFIGIDGIPDLNRLAIVTAYNPFSRTLGAAQNAERQAQLVDAVEREGLEWLHASGAGAKGEWPPEPSLAILDPTDPQLDRWMEVFGQNAVVVAECGGLAALRLHPRHIKT
ncbi:MAG: hypothetical protein RJA14_2089 [Pseudomonadota bacterium]